MSHLEDIAIRLQVYLERLKTNDAREFNRVMAVLSSAVTEELRDNEISQMSRSALEKLIRRLNATQREVIEESVDNLVDNLRGLVLYSYQFEAGAIVAGSSVSKLVESLSEDILWDEVLKQPMSANGSLLEPWLKKLTDNQIIAIGSTLRRAHMEGWTNSQILQVIRGTRANRFKDGIMEKIGRGNETIIRTAMQHVSSVGRKKLWEENADIIKGYRWVSTLDRRTSNQCRSLDGKVFEVGKGPLPPIHPNCRSTTVAVIDSVYDVFDRGATRASASGSVPQNQSYYEWLKNQTPDFQDSVIGPTRGILLRQGGLTSEEFSRLQLNSTFDPLTLDEMRKLKPLAFERAGI